MMTTSDHQRKLAVPRVMFVCGPIGAGKSTVVRNYQTALTNCPAAYNVQVISVSDVVRNLVGTREMPTKDELSRDNLQATKHLGEGVARWVTTLIGNYFTSAAYPADVVIVDGVRQLCIIDQVVARFGWSNCEFVWVDPGEKERRRRYEVRQQEQPGKDTADFDTACKRDNELGLGEIRAKLLMHIKFLEDE